MDLQQQRGNSNAPIPLIQFEGQQFRITDEAVNFLRKLEGPIGIITIVGKYRTGKSLFLNKVLLNNSESFKVCPTINSCTKGLWMSRQVIKSEHPDCPDMDTVVIDTEGFGAMQQTDAYNNRILLFALLLSSYFIYNSVGSIDEKSLNNLNIITNLAKQLQAKNMSHDKIEDQFPSFLWVVRDFTLRLVDTTGEVMEPKEYLEYALEIQKGISDAVENKNKIRRMIKHFFKERDCYTLVTPVENEMDLQRLNSLPDESLRPQFLEQIQSLRQKILKRVKPKRLKNRKLTGQTFLQLANSYVESINSGSLPNIESAWKSINNFQISQTVSKTKQLIQKKSYQFMSNLQSEKGFDELEKQLLNESLLFMKKKIANEGDLEHQCAYIKQYIGQVVNKAKVENKRKSMTLLVQHFHQKCEEFGYEESAEALDKKWKALEQLYRSEFKENPSLHEFLVDEFYPFKFEAFTCLIKHQAEGLKSLQEQKQMIKQTYEKRLHESDQHGKQKEEKLQDSQRQATFLKARSEEEAKIKNLQIAYLQKQLDETKEQLYKQETKSESLAGELKERETELGELRLKLNSISFGLKESDDDRNLTKKQLQILKVNLNNKIRQIEELKKWNSELKFEIEKIEEREKSNIYHNQSQIDNKSQQYEELLSNYQQLQAECQSQSQKIAKLESTLDLQANRIVKEEKLYESMLQTLKVNFETERQHTVDLTQANRNMAFALKHLEQRFQQAEEKEKKMKEFKRCFKNSSCMQCQNCSKFFVPPIFSQHLNVCILGPENIMKNDGKVSNSGIEISVKQTLLKDSDSKPYTEYVLEIKKADKLWTINRKYKQFCNLHGKLKTLLPGVNLSEHSYIVSPQESSKKSLLVEERRKIFEKYLRDLCCNPYIVQQRIWKQFIQDPDTDSITPILPSNPHKLSHKSETSIQRPIAQKQSCQSPQKQNTCDSNRHLAPTHNHKTPEQFLRIWNERNLRAKEISKNKKGWNN